ncbi:GNAT family N-acetyltransferase [Halobacteria archaeon AArc-curdl1]|uniref:GNAT family N-acetyltransferase n=1 Tax=Natronosalvus hydrolyticus TaxID=2979988 RepID=A0AAP3E5V0_9EURY|nr:GNAT family N-acetyltransferase [Halobacteria archaeon AArc-curdl1]
MVTVRPAQPTDGEALVAVHVAAIRELGSSAYDDEQIEAWAAKKDPSGYPVEEETAHFVVATRDDDVVGFGHLALDAAEIRAVYVHPDHARDGVGTTILEHLERTALDAGLEDLSLLASKNAVEFYERHGWTSGEWVDHESTGGVTLECLWMEKSLPG